MLDRKVLETLYMVVRIEKPYSVVCSKPAYSIPESWQNACKETGLSRDELLAKGYRCKPVSICYDVTTEIVNQ